MIKVIQSKDREYQAGLKKNNYINYNDVMLQFNMANIGDAWAALLSGHA